MENNTKPKVSVIVPIYNQQQLIGEAIKSILSQTFQDFEIIITDDGSTDGTLAEINKFSDSRIKTFSFEKNRGISNALNNCIENSNGEYIALLNSDDTFMPNKLEKQVEFLDKNKDVAAVFTLANIINENGTPFENKNHFYFSIFNQPNRTRFEWLRHFFYNGNCLCHPSMMARKSCLQEAGLYDIRFHQMQDFELYLRILMKHDVHIIQEKLTNFRVLENEKNVSGNRPDSRNRTAWEMEKILDDYLKIEVNEFGKIFPEAEKFKMPLDKDLIPFYIAMISLKVDNITHKRFALQSLHDLMQSGYVLRKMQDLENFYSQDLVRLTGETGIFQMQEIAFMLSSKFWKLREKYLNIKNRLKI